MTLGRLRNAGTIPPASGLAKETPCTGPKRRSAARARAAYRSRSRR